MDIHAALGHASKHATIPIRLAELHGLVACGVTPGGHALAQGLVSVDHQW